MILPEAPHAYEQAKFNQIIRALRTALNGCWRRGSNIEIAREELILQSPNGSRWAVKVADDGTLSAEARS